MSVEEHVQRQAGVLSRGQALAAGLSAGEVERLVSRRLWTVVHPRVYLVRGHRLGDEARVRAAVLWAGEGAVPSGLAAAWWLGLAARAPATVTVTVPLRRDVAPRPGVRVRRHTLPAADLGEHGGLAVTAPPLAVLEAAVELGAAGRGYLDGVLGCAVAFADVRAAQARWAGRPGSAAAARLLAAAADGAAAGARRRLAGLLRAGGLRGWVERHRIEGHAVDVAFPRAAVAVETATWPDVCRHAALRRRGWTLLRFDGSELARRPQQVLAEIGREVTRARWVTT